MKSFLFTCMALFVAAPVLADDAKPAAAPDMSKMGPWSRKPTDVKKTTKEIMDFFQMQGDIAKKGDFAGQLATVDFPVYMVSDDAQGVPTASLWSVEKYTMVMKGSFDGPQKESKITHKPTVVVLSDSLVSVTDAFTMMMGKDKVSGVNLSVLVKRDGAWKWKVMGEAGWGGMASAEAKPEVKAEVKAEAKPAAKPDAAAPGKGELPKK